MAIIVDTITRNYGSQKALDQVSFTVQPGQVVGFLGPNGAGKSTMMKIIACFLPQTSGKVTVDGFDVNDQPVEVRRRVGYLPEHNPLYVDMYVKEFLEFAGGIHMGGKQLKGRVKEMIEVTGLGPEQHKQIGALSKGYRQRVGLAQAMIHDPGVLILDEPTTGLDPNQLADIRQLIRTIGKEKTVVLSTHIMQEVEAICDRAIIISKGKIVADDSTEKLLQLGVSNAVLTVEFDKPVRREQLLQLPGVRKAEQQHNLQNWKLTTDGKDDVRPVVFRFAVDNGLAVITMQQENANLESIFRQLTGKN